MNAWKNIYRSTLAVMLSAMLLTACVKEDPCPPDIPDAEYTELVIRIILPSIPLPGITSSSPETRALNDVKESEVKDATVLLFASDGSLVTRADARDITPEGAVATAVEFSVRVPTGTFDVMILANCEGLLSGFSPSAQTKAAYRELMLTLDGKWNTGTASTPLPFWGEVRNTTITPNATFAGTDAIRLTRCVARIELSVDRSAVTTPFTLQSVKMYHWSSRSRIIPDDNAWSISENKATGVSSGSQVTTASQAQEYTEFDTDGNITKTIYVPETPAGTAGALTGNPCLLIRANYDGTVGWYKMEFSDGNDDLLPLLRNHKYQAVIREVTGRGYATESEAYNAKATNIKTEILYNDDATLTNLMYDGEYYLAWDPGDIEFTREARADESTDNKMIIESNCEGGWQMGTIQYTTTGQSGWLTPSVNSGNKGRISLSLNVTQNNSGTTRTAEIPITAGTMDCRIKVTQTSAPSVWVRIYDQEGNEVTNGSTRWHKTPQGRNVDREYTIEWGPKEASCVVTSARPNEINADLLFESGRGITAETLNDDNGSHLYALRFQPLLESRDYDQNNGSLRSYGNEYTFTVTNEGSTAQTKIILRHHLDMIRSTLDPIGYRMGFQHGFNLYSSTSYRVTGFADPSSVQYNNGISGADVTVADGATNAQSYNFRLRNPKKEKDGARIGINLTFPTSDLPDTTLYIQANYMHSNSYMAVPGTTVRIPVKTVLQRWRHEWLANESIPDLTGMQTYVMWSTAIGLITSVTLTPTMNPDPETAEIEVQVGTGQTGNALVSLEVGGNVVWSWHIWVTNYVPGNNGNPNGNAGTGLFNYSTAFPFVLMDRNLGALGYLPTHDRRSISGMYYQFGRKDPFPYINFEIPDGTTSRQSRPVPNNMTLLPVRRRAFTSYTHSPGNTAYYFNFRRSIENPTQFILAPSHPYDWLDQVSNASSTGRWFINNDGFYKKSVWDPCPDGWQVAPDAFGTIPEMANGVRSTAYGVTTSDYNYWPAAGLIDHAQFNYRNQGFDMNIATLYTARSSNVDGTSVSEYRGGFLLAARANQVSGNPVYSRVGEPMARGIPVRCMRELSYPPQYN